MMREPLDIILRPVITEKTTDLMRERKYVFEVDPRATKLEIRKAVEAIFGVTVEKVNTMPVRGKLKRQGRSVGRTKSWKKAIVKLTSDSKTPDFFEGVQA